MIEVSARISIRLTAEELFQFSEENEEIDDVTVGMALQEAIGHTGATVDEIEGWYIV